MSGGYDSFHIQAVANNKKNKYDAKPNQIGSYMRASQGETQYQINFTIWIERLKNNQK